MRTLLVVLALAVGPLAAWADAQTTVECFNESDDFYEDSLTIDFAKNEAVYFDNDVYRTFSCARLNNLYVCAGSHFLLKVKPSGETWVYEGDGKPNVIPFSCEGVPKQKLVIKTPKAL